MTSLYTENSVIGILLTIFLPCFALRRDRRTICWRGSSSLSRLWNRFRKFLSKQTDALLNIYYRALSNGLVTDASIRPAVALRALAIAPEALWQEPILLNVDDTTIAK